MVKAMPRYADVPGGCKRKLLRTKRMGVSQKVPKRFLRAKEPLHCRWTTPATAGNADV